MTSNEPHRYALTGELNGLFRSEQPTASSTHWLARKALGGFVGGLIGLFMGGALGCALGAVADSISPPGGEVPIPAAAVCLVCGAMLGSAGGSVGGLIPRPVWGTYAGALVCLGPTVLASRCFRTGDNMDYFFLVAQPLSMLAGGLGGLVGSWVGRCRD